MSNIDKQALREAAQEEIMLRSVSDTSDSWLDEASPEAVLALLDELEA
ncbi:ead/Ea22-like family protein, partial [Escherichia coli]|nr:ead/Ea22-like family protein [Escherichia coli]